MFVAVSRGTRSPLGAGQEGSMVTWSRASVSVRSDQSAMGHSMGDQRQGPDVPWPVSMSDPKEGGGRWHSGKVARRIKAGGPHPHPLHVTL